jgi:chemotaxis protein methyltransferase CheR
VLKPGGYLLLGGAESTLNLDGAFQRVELGRAVVFRHTGGAA